MKTDVLLADDHPIFLEAIKKFLEPSCRVVGTAQDGYSMISLAQKLKPDVTIIDAYMPLINGLDACERLLKRVPETRVVLLGVSDAIDTAEEALRRGACGYILKKSASAELLEAVQSVTAGRVYVTPLIREEPMSSFVARAFRMRRSSGLRNGLRPCHRACLLGEAA